MSNQPYALLDEPRKQQAAAYNSNFAGVQVQPGPVTQPAAACCQEQQRPAQTMLLPNGQMLGPAHTYQVISVKEAGRSLLFYPVRSSVTLGVLQIICGVACIILTICFSMFAARAGAAYVYAGISFWLNACTIIGGSLQIVSAYKKSQCLIVSYIVLAILSTCYSLAAFVAFVGLAAELDNSYRQDSDRYDYSSYSYSSAIQSEVTIAVLHAVFSGIQIILAIWSFGIGCQFCCCPCCKCCWKCCCPCYNTKGDASNYERMQIIKLQVQLQPDPQPLPPSYPTNGVGFSNPQQPPSYA